MDALRQSLLAEFQRDFPLVPRPYGAVAERLGCTEAEVIRAFVHMKAEGVVSRVGPVIAPHSIGASTLAAMAVPPERLAEVAETISAYPEVNHNYEREHRFNLWFVVTAPDRSAIDAVLADMTRRTGIAVLDLPMLDGYHLDLGFDLAWS